MSKEYCNLILYSEFLPLFSKFRHIGAETREKFIKFKLVLKIYDLI